MFVTVLLHQTQVNFINVLPNTLTSTTRLKKCKVAPVSLGKMCFRNIIFVLPPKVGKNYPAVYSPLKNGLYYFHFLHHPSRSHLGSHHTCVRSQASPHDAYEVVINDVKRLCTGDWNNQKRNGLEIESRIA
jgi:hypothetical protein